MARMASLIYNSAIFDASTGAIDFDTDTFKMMLVTSSYTAAKTHTKRNAVTNEVSGTGYTAGGNAAAATVTKDDTNSRVDITFAITSWTSSTITARAGVIYKSRGGASSADELVGYVDFGSDISSTSGTFSVTITSPLRFQN
jgi:hypothetical protein